MASNHAPARHGTAVCTVVLGASGQGNECGHRFRTNDLHGAGGRSISDQTTQEAALGGMGIWDPRTEARGEDEWKLGAATRERCRTCAGAALGSAQEADLLEDEAGADEGAGGDGERQALGVVGHHLGTIDHGAKLGASMYSAELPAK